LIFERGCIQPADPRIVRVKEVFELDLSQMAYVNTWRKMARRCVDASKGEA